VNNSNNKKNIKLNAVILCGGRSSRMGQNKALLPFNLDQKSNEEKTMLDFQYEKLSKIFNKVYISSKFEDDFKQYDTIIDDSLIHSPMIALKSIFESIKDDEVFIITVDTPLISEKTIKKLLDFYKNNNFQIVIPQDNNEKIHNLCGVFSSSIKDKIDNCLNTNMHKINHLIQHSKHCIIGINTNIEFLNINTPVDYNLALKQLK
jgi:molybdopterin-guanine dinucleotide biosynthesis protein A